MPTEHGTSPDTQTPGAPSGRTRPQVAPLFTLHPTQPLPPFHELARSLKPNLQFPETQRLEELPRECGEPVTRQVSARRTNTGALQGRSGTGDAPGSTPGHVAGAWPRRRPSPLLRSATHIPASS